MVEINRFSVFGPREPMRTVAPFQLLAGATVPSIDPIMSGLGAAMRTQGILQSLGDFRQRKEMNRLQLAEIKKQQALQQRKLDAVRAASSFDPISGTMTVDRKKLVGLVAQFAPDEALRMQQEFTALGIREQQAELQRLRQQQAEIEREAEASAPGEAAAATRVLGEHETEPFLDLQSQLELQGIQQRGMPAQPRLGTLEERAAAGQPFAAEAMELRGKSRAEQRANEAVLMSDALAGRAVQQEKAQREFDATLPAVERIKDIELYINRDSADFVEQGQTTGEFRRKSRAGAYRKLSQKEATAHGQVLDIIPVLEEIRTDLQAVYGTQGIYDNLEPGLLNRIKAGAKGIVANKLQTDTNLTTLYRRIQGNVDLLRRNFSGQVGTQTEQDAKRGLKTLPSVLALLPDTKDVAFTTLNSLIKLVNNMIARRVKKRGFQHPSLHALQTSSAAAPAPTPPAPPPPVQPPPEQGAPVSARQEVDTIIQELRKLGVPEEEIRRRINEMMRR